MFLTSDIFEAVDDDREDLVPEAAERPLALLAHLELVSADSWASAAEEPVDLDPPTPPLPYVAA